jgi:hypothetical protein
MHYTLCIYFVLHSAFLVRNLGELTDLELADILPGPERFLNTSKGGSSVDSAIASYASPGWKVPSKKQTAKGKALLLRNARI